MAGVIHTVGHSTRSLEELIGILERAKVRELIDVRSVPRSRRHPHFAREALAESLEGRGLGYRHEPALGGFRRPDPNSPNGGWTQPAFRGYADDMNCAAFRGALERLEAGAREWQVCLMCAEAQWWRCHRRLIADALVVRDWRVCHLGLAGEAVGHELTEFAIVGPGLTLTYPPRQGQLLPVRDS